DAPLFGQTLNPINPDYTCGASSGGAAVAIATGMGALALGSDGGGSIRIPASCCGIVGLKATLGRIPNLQASDLIGVNSYVGPMTRDIADARLYYEVLQGPDARDPWGKALLQAGPRKHTASSWQAQPSHGDSDTPLQGLRVAYLPSAGNYVHSEVKAAADQLARQLSDAGAAVEEIQSDFVAYEKHFLVLLESLTATRVQPFLERYHDRLDPSVIRLTERGKQHSAIDLHHAIQARTTCYQQLEGIFSQYDILLSPTVSAPPLPVNTDPNGLITIEGREVGTIRGAWYPTTYPMNLSGHPALSLPYGTSSEGLPIGMQLCGPWYSEELLLDVAQVVEAMVG